MPEIVVIAAVAEAPGHPSDRLIGDGMNLPWHLPADLKRFKALTSGFPLVMGRRTFESLVHQFGGPLPNRDNVVLTSRPERVDHPGVEVFTSLDDAVDAFADRQRVFIGGGAGVYASVLEPGATVQADRLELTFVQGTFEGDTYFPPYRQLVRPGGPYRRVQSEAHASRDGRPPFRFDTFERSV